MGKKFYAVRTRRTRKRLAVTPAIATMILLSATLVLALVVGAYTSGMFEPSVSRVNLTAILLYDGVSTDNVSVSATSSIGFVLKNPGQATNISSILLIGASLQVPIESWSTTAVPSSGNSFLVDDHNYLPGGSSAAYTFYPMQNPSVSLLTGQTFDYVISLSNGQTISGSLIAQ